MLNRYVFLIQVPTLMKLYPFYYIKVGFKGVYVKRICFPDPGTHFNETNEKGYGPYNGFSYSSFVSDPLDSAKWSQKELLLHLSHKDQHYPNRLENEKFPSSIPRKKVLTETWKLNKYTCKPPPLGFPSYIVVYWLF